MFYRLPAPGLMALEQAAAAGRVGEVALIANRLIQPLSLGWIAPADGARVIIALQTAGLDEASDSLAEELVRSHLLRRHFIGYGG